MSSHGGGKVGDFGLLIIFLIILFFLWYMLGGKKHEAVKEGAYTLPLTEKISPSPVKDNNLPSTQEKTTTTTRERVYTNTGEVDNGDDL